ncbi:hypothetical protein CARUB_v10003680mg, partial [Capsella rubella]
MDIETDDEVDDESDDEVETPNSEKTEKSKGKNTKQERRQGLGFGIISLDSKKSQTTVLAITMGKDWAVQPSLQPTSTLKKHVTKTCKAYQVWLSANKDKAQTVLTPDGVGGDVRVSRVSESVFRKACNELLVLAQLPLAFIESLAMRHFCSKLQLYKPHSRRTATRDIVEMFVKKRAAMKKILEHNSQRMSLTTDIWTATTTRASYMVITAHFVDDMWRLRKMIIGFKNVSDYKGETICNCLLECLAEWGIKKVFCITVDKATANSLAMNMFKKEMMQQNGNDALVLKGEYLHLRCAAHILNLVLKEGLQDIDRSVAAVRNGIQYARSTPNRLKAFVFRVETGKVKRGSLPLDVKTLWNSTYLMLEQALKFRVAFEKLQAEDKPYNDYFLERVDGHKRFGPPMKDDLDEVSAFVQVLGIFYNSTLVLSASNSVASHKIYNEIVSITRNLTIYSTTGDDEELHKRSSAILTKLEKYWDVFGDKVEMNRLVIVASVFDPRKKMKFVEVCFDHLYGKGSVESSHLSDSINNILKNLYDEYTRASLLNTSGSSSQSQSSWSQAQDQFETDISQRTHHIGLPDMDSIFQDIVKEAGIRKSSNELEMYLKEDVESVNSGKYPILSMIAKDILAMQVSSVALEAAFSTSNRLLDSSRSCLTHYMIEVLMCTKQWLK